MVNSGEMQDFSFKLWINTRRISKAQEASLYIQVLLSGKHKEYPLKLKWPVNKIDVQKGVLLPRQKDDNDVSDYNMIIMDERAKFNEIFKTYRLRREFIDFDKLTRELKIFSTRESFLTYYENQNKLRLRTKQICQKSHDNHQAVISQVKAYDSEALFSNIDKKWMEGFKLFLIKKGYAAGTIWDRIKSVKAYLRLASAENLIYVNEKAFLVKAPIPKTSTTFLNKDEVLNLINLFKTQTLTPIQHNVLSAFLFTCFTSLRISDVYQAQHSWKISNNYIKFQPQKNRKSGKILTIPIMPMAERFITNIKGRYFTLPSEQRYNKTLKVLGAMAGIHKVITSHVGRHTFGYFYMKYEKDIYGLQTILGHEKIETTERYAHLEDEDMLNAVTNIQDNFGEVYPMRLIS